MSNIFFAVTLFSMLTLAGALGLAIISDAEAAEHPQAEITNGEIRAKLYLPDAQRGFYRGTRFDWSGVISALEYKGHNYYGQWFDRIDPQVFDYQFQGEQIVGSTCSSTTGPVEEFQTDHRALGFDEAPVGGTFVKIGVGVLRKNGPKYEGFKQYEIIDPGKWTVKTHADSVEFIQELTDAATGYGYVYRKIVRLVPGKPEMVLEHHLKNTGRRPIQSTVYNHNFLVLDRQPSGPDFAVTFPFQLHSSNPPDQALAEIRGNQVVYLKTLAEREVVFTSLLGFSDSPKDHEIRIQNSRVGAGMVIRSDRPLANLNFWSINRVLAVEPFVSMTIAPGAEFGWDWSYEFYTVAPKLK